MYIVLLKPIIRYVKVIYVWISYNPILLQAPVAS